MTPFYADDWLTLYGGDCREVLASLPSDSVDCVVTSPPYWGLRDYGAEEQLGLERTPEEYVANMVAVFREVRRVLKPSGTCWLNLGDSYGHGTDARRERSKTSTKVSEAQHEAQGGRHGGMAKQLVGIPWRVAFALQADGWYLRSDIIWSKPNPMPESVTDRPTKSHEYLFLLTKSARYFFDSDAVREDAISAGQVRGGGQKASTNGIHANRSDGQNLDRLGQLPTASGRNIRSVWNIATRPYPGAHFAVFPPELPERCIKAGSSEKGVCPHTGDPWERVTEKGQAVRVRQGSDTSAAVSVETAQGRHGASSIFATGTKHESITTGWRPTCGAPWERVVERTATTSDGRQRPSPADGEAHRATDHPRLPGALSYETKTTGWKPTCDHDAAPVPAVVLDPFGGSGTVGMVANRLSRRAILIDLNPAYLQQQLTRNAQTPLGLTEGDAA